MRAYQQDAELQNQADRRERLLFNRFLTRLCLREGVRGARHYRNYVLSILLEPSILEATTHS